MNAKKLHAKILERMKLSDGKFKEDEHPRANDGKFGEKGSGKSAQSKSKRIKKQPHDESYKDTPEYDIRLADKKIAKIKAQLDKLKSEYKDKYGEEFKPGTKDHVDNVQNKAKDALGEKARSKKPQFMNREPDHTKPKVKPEQKSVTNAQADAPKSAAPTDINESINVVISQIADDKFEEFEADFTKLASAAPVQMFTPDEIKKVHVAHQMSFETDEDNARQHKVGSKRGKDVQDPSILIKYGQNIYALDGQHRLSRAFDAGQDAAVVILQGEDFLKYGLKENFFSGRKQRLKRVKMSLGKLIRQKMKELEADHSGEYIDKNGRAFTMAIVDDGYVVGYGGEAMNEIKITKPQAVELRNGCRKLEAAAPKEDLTKAPPSTTVE